MTYVVPEPPKFSDENSLRWEMWKAEVSKIRCPRVLQSRSDNSSPIALSSAQSVCKIPILLWRSDTFHCSIALSGEGTTIGDSVTLRFSHDAGTSSVTFGTLPSSGANSLWRFTGSIFCTRTATTVQVRVEQSDFRWIRSNTLLGQTFNTLEFTETTNSLEVQLIGTGTDYRTAQVVMFPPA